jgi:hypothetical protein
MYALQRSVSGRENQLVETCVSVYRSSSGPVAFLAIEGFTADLTSLGKSTSACSGLVSVDEGTLRGFRLRSTAGLGEEGVVSEEGSEKHVRRKKIRRRRRRQEHRRMRERGVGCR